MDNEQGKRWLWFEKLTQIACQYFESEGTEAELVTATQLPKKNQLLIINDNNYTIRTRVN